MTTDRCLQPSRALADAADEAMRAVDHITAEVQARPRPDEAAEAGRHLRDLTAQVRQAEADDSLTALMITVQDGFEETAAAVAAVRAMTIEARPD